MFTDRSTGALARPHVIARLATVAAALLVTLIFSTSYQQALAHDGHDHDAAPAALPAAMQPRAPAVGDEIEAVAVIKGDDLLIYVTVLVTTARCLRPTSSSPSTRSSIARRPCLTAFF